MGNLVAYCALMIWPLVSFTMYKNMNVVAATFLTLCWGYLLLPANFEIDFPLIPPLHKESIGALCTLLFLRFVKNSVVISCFMSSIVGNEEKYQGVERDENVVKSEPDSAVAVAMEIAKKKENDHENVTLC